MAALIPALIQLLLSRRRGGGGGYSRSGYSKGGGKGGYSKGGGKEQRSPEEYSMELLDKNARKAGIQQQEPAQYSLRSQAAASLEQLIESQTKLMKSLSSDDEE